MIQLPLNNSKKYTGKKLDNESLWANYIGSFV